MEKLKLLFGFVFFMFAVNLYTGRVDGLIASIFSNPFLSLLVVMNNAVFIALFYFFYVCDVIDVASDVFRLGLVSLIVSSAYLFTTQKVVGIVVGLAILLAQVVAVLRVKNKNCS